MIYIFTYLYNFIYIIINFYTMYYLGTFRYLLFRLLYMIIIPVL